MKRGMLEVKYASIIEHIDCVHPNMCDMQNGRGRRCLPNNVVVIAGYSYTVRLQTARKPTSSKPSMSKNKGIVCRTKGNRSNPIVANVGEQEEKKNRRLRNRNHNLNPKITPRGILRMMRLLLRNASTDVDEDRCIGNIARGPDNVSLGVVCYFLALEGTWMKEAFGDARDVEVQRLLHALLPDRHLSL